jgi:hypothetical protein
MPDPRDDNLIRMMLQPPKLRGKDDPIVVAARKVERKSAKEAAARRYRAKRRQRQIEEPQQLSLF